jgi:hypothetical protein
MASKEVAFVFVNPRKIVGVEAQKALVEAQWIVIGEMCRLPLRNGMQLALDLFLSLSWAFGLWETV